MLPKAAIDSDASVWEDTRSPLYNDMALVFATAPDFVSYRNTVDGSIFIQKFCKVFNKYVHRLDLHSMLNLVRKHRISFNFIHKVFNFLFLFSSSRSAGKCPNSSSWTPLIN